MRLSFIASRSAGIETLQFSTGHRGIIRPHRCGILASEGFVEFELNGQPLGDASARRHAFETMTDIIERTAPLPH